MLDKLKTWVKTWMDSPIRRKDLVYACLATGLTVAAWALLV